LTGSPKCWREKVNGASSGPTNFRHRCSPRISSNCSTSCIRSSACVTGHYSTRRSGRAAQRSGEMIPVLVAVGRNLRNAAATRGHQLYIDVYTAPYHRGDLERGPGLERSGAHDVTQSAGDCGQLIPMTDAIEINLGRSRSSYRRTLATVRRPILRRWRTATSMPMWRPAGPETRLPAPLQVSRAALGYPIRRQAKNRVNLASSPCQ
jgi:hypothetical protein